MFKHKFEIVFVLPWLFLTACNLPGLTAPTSQPGRQSDATPIRQVDSTCEQAWTFQELNEISTQLDKAITAKAPRGSGYARVYGNGCTFADGRINFEAVETNFWIHIPVQNFDDENELGLWIVNIMQIIRAYPPGVIPGSRNGLVQIDFVAPTTEVKMAGVSIDRYINLPRGLSNAKIFETFHSYP